MNFCVVGSCLVFGGDGAVCHSWGKVAMVTRDIPAIMAVVSQLSHLADHRVNGRWAESGKYRLIVVALE